MPQADIDAALAAPEKVYGWNKLMFPSLPESLFNPRRKNLTLLNINTPYHPPFNGLVFAVGCPH